MNRFLCAAAALCGLFAVALLPDPASAQETTSDSRGVLEEILVTAQKREQRLQDVALSLAVVDEATLRDAGVSEIDDIVLLTPGLDFSQTLGRQNTTPLIRGIAPQFLTDPTVVVFTDGFTLGFTRLINNALLADLERIEVLKGPQATLYGRNALGGVINYVTKKPAETFGGAVSAEYGSYESYQVSASLTGPIAADHLYGRLTAGARGLGGYLDNTFSGERDVNEEQDLTARASLRWLPAESVDVDFTATFGQGNDACGDCSHIARAYNRTNLNRFAEIGAGLLDFNDVSNTTNMSFLGSYDREDGTVSINTEYAGPTVTVTSITGYGYIDTLLLGDSNGPSVGTFVPGVPGYTVVNKIEGWSEELRLASSGDDRLTWLVGAYGYRSTTDGSLAFGPVFLSNSSREINNYAGFANAEYALAEMFSVAAGLRYDYERQEFLNRRTGRPTRRSGSELLPRLSVSYKPGQDMHWYVSASRGYHAGGFNDPRAPRTEFDSEYVWNYEIGLKASMLENRAQVQVTAFYIDWDSQQINQTTNVPGGSSVGYTDNAGASRISGLEAALQWSVTERFNLSAAVALMDSELKSFEDPIVAPRFGLDANLSGNELPFAPDVSGTVSAQYLAPLGAVSGWKMRLRTDVRYMGERYFETVNLMRADAYWLANVYAGVQNGRYQIGAFADNLFDAEYLTGGTLPDAVFPPEVTIGHPRTYGVRLNARF